MAKPAKLVVFGLGLLALGFAAAWRQQTSARGRVLSGAADESGVYPALRILFPADGTVFPPGMAAPTCRWDDPHGADTWQVLVTVRHGPGPLVFEVTSPAWIPGPSTWKTIQRASREADASITVLGHRRSEPGRIRSRGRVTFRTSDDEIGALLFYREVTLPFIEAVRDPSRIRWRLGAVGSPAPPPVVLEGMPVCGNCHSFPRQGDWLAMDVDYANSKGSYVIAPVAEEMALRPRDIITWDDYRRDEKEPTFGLLSQISPDGQVVVSTVKDRSVFVPKPDLEFSQLFFPIKGILAIYDRRTRTFRALPGADNPEYVQSNPTWSPDGQYIVFARAKAYQLRRAPATGKTLLSPEECAEFLQDGKSFRFDLYRIPYNGGRGGQAEPLEGASQNDRSNYFARYSPDGRWIVFCQARNYMLLQPDSELYLIPAAGGPARRLDANTGRMNSWHSWTPNSRWLVFSSKANSPYTQLFLTHIDPEGQSSPALCLANLTAPDRAANIPEFVTLSSASIRHITARFLDDDSHARAGYVCETTGDTERAIREYLKALELNPENPHAHERLGYLYGRVKNDPDRGAAHCRKAIAAAPLNGQAHFILGRLLVQQPHPLDEAVDELRAAQRLLPTSLSTDPEYTLAGIRRYLGLAYMVRGDLARSAAEFRGGLEADAANPELRFALAACLVQQGLIDEPLAEYARAVAVRPAFTNAPQFHNALALNYARAGRFPEASKAARTALASAAAAQDADLIRQIRRRLAEYDRGVLPAEPE